jgi:hypothetical protein
LQGFVDERIAERAAERLCNDGAKQWTEGDYRVYRFAYAVGGDRGWLGRWRGGGARWKEQQ